MALTTPILNATSPFNATREYILKFQSYGGDQIYKNNLVIERTSDNTEVYNKETITFLLECPIPANTLTNGVEYRFKVRTGDAAGNYSAFSQSIIIKPLADPVLSIVNITGGKVKNQVYTFQGNYLQANGEILESYSFRLYNQNGVIIARGVTKYDGLLEETFDSLQNGHTYAIDFTIKTLSGLESASEQFLFTVEYIETTLGNVVVLENQPDTGSIKVSSEIIRIVGEIGGGTVHYEDDDWVNLKDGMIFFDDGFYLEQDFSLRIWLKNIGLDTHFLKLFSPMGNLWLTLEYRNNIYKFYAYKQATGHSKYYFVYSNPFDYSETRPFCLYLKQSANTLTLQVLDEFLLETDLENESPEYFLEVANIVEPVKNFQDPDFIINID